MNENIISNLHTIPFSIYPVHYPYMGLDILDSENRKNITLIEGGGGGSTKNLLQYIAKHGGKVITLDLCTRPKEIEYIDGKEAGISGDGDYSSKVELYQRIEDDEILSPYFTWVNKDIYEWFKNDYTEPIDYYFDDAVHDSRYLIPLFELIIPRCNPGAIIGTHDKQEKEMQEFITWLKNHPRVEKIYDTDTYSLMVKLK